MMSKLLFLIILLVNPFSESEWSLKRDKEGIEVYTRSVQGSSFDEFKGITTIDKRSLAEVLAVILDVENYGSLFPDCMNPKVLKKEGYYDVHYLQTKAPLSIKNRDSVYEQRAVIDENGKHAFVSLTPLPDYIAENKDFIRVRKGSGFWDLQEDSNGNVKVIYQFLGEPGGNIPAWLVNSFVVSHPFEVLKNLRKKLMNI